MRDFKLMGTDDVAIKLHEYYVNDCDFIVICVHGMAEHSKRYEAFAEFLNQRKIMAYTYDHRGHGESILSGEGHGYQGKDGFNKMIEDLNRVVDYVKAKSPNKKIFLLGHSMGSFVVQRYIQQYKKVSGVILSGSSYKVFGMRLLKYLGWIICKVKGGKTEGKFMNKVSFGSFNNQFKPNRTEFDWLNSDPKEVDYYIGDNSCGFISTNQFYYDFVKGLITLQSDKEISRIKKNIPIYILSGEEDPVGQNGKKVKQLVEAYKKYSKNIELNLIPNARHEILLETKREEIYQNIVNWLIKQK